MLCILAASPSFAATLTVTTTADSNDGACTVSLCSLRDAVIAANAAPGGHIVLGSGLTYALTLGGLNITSAVTIDGNNSTINGGGSDRAFSIQGNFSATINSVTITNGSAHGFLAGGGGVYVQGATVVLNNCAITGNTTVGVGSFGDGGGVAAIGSFDAPTATPSLAHLTLNGTTVSGNSAANGGGILCALCALTISNSTIASNTANAGDGGGIDVLGNSSTLSMTNSTLAGNSVSGGNARGGGLSAPFGTSVSTLSLNRIVSNTATAGSAVFSSVGMVSGDDNWWGCNYGPGTGGVGCAAAPNGTAGSFLMTRYLVLKISAAPPTIPLGATSTVSANLTFNSLNNSTAAGGFVPNGISAAFTGSGGTLATPSSTTSNGVATDVYTAVGPKQQATLTAAVDGQTVSMLINIGSQSFTDDPLVAGVTVVRAVHIDELRTRIDSIRASYGLLAFAYTDTTITAGSIIRAVDVTELRTALSEVYAAALRSAPTYADAGLSSGTTIKVVHIAEIRTAILGIE